MKFFSRKALVASATAVAVAFGGASVASAQESAPSTTPVAATTTTSTTSTPAASNPTSKAKEGSSITDMEPKEIRDWIAVFTAFIGALGTLMAFLSKYFKMPF